MLPDAEGTPLALGSLSRKLAMALAMLFDGACYAEETSSSGWEYAVEIDTLMRRGRLTHNDLRFLVQKRYIKHAEEITKRGARRRRFVATGEAVFTPQTCFVLTDTGVAIAKSIIANLRIRKARRLRRQVILVGIPVWDVERRELSMNGVVLKKLRGHADNQETILNVFQEENWPARIDDPLSPDDGIDSKQRLHDAIKCLNRHHLHKAIHFSGDGTAQGILWARDP